MRENNLKNEKIWKLNLAIVWKSFVLLLSSIIIGYFLLVAVYMLPLDSVGGHVETTAAVLSEEGVPYFAIPGFETSYVDNYTDGMMYGMTSCNDENNPFIAAADSQKYAYEDQDMFQSFISYGAGKTGYMLQSYALYWHGYLIFLKPLLFVGEIGTIRMLNMFVQLAVAGVFLMGLWKKSRKEYGVSFLVAYFFWTPITLFLCLQFSDIYYISMISMIVLLYFYDKMKKKKYIPYFFLMIGIFTAYFDLLTYPVVALGLPLVMYILLDSEQENSVIKQLLGMIGYSIAWGVGYLGMWMGKWVLASLIMGRNVIMEALNEILYRTSNVNDNEPLNTMDVIHSNTDLYKHRIYYIIILLFLIYVCIRACRLGVKEMKIRLRSSLCYTIPLCMIACYPYVWYALTANHSYIHNWVAHKELVLTVFSVSSLLLALTRTQPIEQKDKKEHVI